MKKALKIKYEARLTSMKQEFESKFRKNDLTWKKLIKEIMEIKE